MYFKQHELELIYSTPKRTYVKPSDMRSVLERRKFEFVQHDISIQNGKGGVGKTLLAWLLASRAAHYGFKVLVDLDQQANLTQSFGVDAYKQPVLIDYIQKKVGIRELIVNVGDNVDLIPSNLSNSRTEIELSSSQTFDTKTFLKKMLAPIRASYDLVIYDCAPALSKINSSAICASSLVLIPVMPEKFPVHGLKITIASIKELMEAHDLKDIDYRILWNAIPSNSNLANFYIDALEAMPKIKNHVLPFSIRTNTDFKTALATGATSVFSTPKKTNIREDADQLTKELLGPAKTVD